MNRQQAAKIFDEFPDDKKDMPRSEFIRQACALTDSKQMKQDMGKIMAEKKRRGMMADINRTSIDRTLER